MIFLFILISPYLLYAETSNCTKNYLSSDCIKDSFSKDDQDFSKLMTKISTLHDNERPQSYYEIKQKILLAQVSKSLYMMSGKVMREQISLYSLPKIGVGIRTNKCSIDESRMSNERLHLLSLECRKLKLF